MQMPRSVDEKYDVNANKVNPPDFGWCLAKYDLALNKGEITTLQINVGLYCNQSCRHCHLNAGPHRQEMMSDETIAQVVTYAKACNFHTIDLTGGAPELHPRIDFIIQSLRPLCREMILRSNLTALAMKEKPLMALLTDNRVKIVASFPSLNEAQLESVRGNGIFSKSIRTLKILNTFGYGRQNTGLALDLVVNPTGAFLPPSQTGNEKRYHQVLQGKWGIAFNKLYSFANVPLGRFREWLVESGNLEKYVEKLAGVFNPGTVAGLMCRNIVSVSWDGYLFDCDFNQAVRLYLGNQKRHVSHLTKPPQPGTPITVGEHCYTCTAGSGFT